MADFKLLPVFSGFHSCSKGDRIPARGSIITPIGKKVNINML